MAGCELQPSVSTWPPGRATSSSAGASTGRPSRFEMAESRNYHPQTGTNFSNALPLRIKAIEFERGYVINKKVYKKDSCNMYLYFFFSKTIITPNMVRRSMVSSFFGTISPSRASFTTTIGVSTIIPENIENTPFGVKSKRIDVIQLNFTHFLFHQGRGFVQQRPGDLSRTGGGSSHGYRIKVGVAGSSGRKRAWRFWTHIVKNQVAALCTVRNSRIQKKSTAGKGKVE